MLQYTTILKKHGEVGSKVFWVLNGLGASPYNPNLPAKLRTLPIVYSIIILTWFTALIPLNTYILADHRVSIAAATVFLQKSCESLVPVLIIVRSLLDNAYKDVVGDVVYADQCLFTVGVEVDFDLIKQFIERSYVCVSVYVATLLGFIGYFVLDVLQDFAPFNSIVLFTLVVSSQIMYSVYFTYYFSCITALFKYRFKFLNEEIVGLSPRHREGRTIIVVKPYNLSTATKIKTIKFVHAIYREVILDHNKYFGYAISLQLFQCLTMLTMSIFILLCVLLNIENVQDSDMYVVAVFMAIIFQCATTVCAITISCARTSSEANSMENAVHDLMNEIEDKNVLQELQNFSLELIHGKVVFTACGFFTIDYSFFTKIVGSVVSNVIIFMQFGYFDYHELLVFVKKDSNNNTLT